MKNATERQEDFIVWLDGHVVGGLEAPASHAFSRKDMECAFHAGYGRGVADGAAMHGVGEDIIGDLQFKNGAPVTHQGAPKKQR